MNRRDFIKRGIVSAATIQISGAAALCRAETAASNPLPRWKGFNLTEFVYPRPFPGQRTKDDDLKWMVDWGFDFVRLPLAYPRYLDFDRSKDITPADVYKINEQEVDRIEAFVRKAQDRGLHVSL